MIPNRFPTYPTDITQHVIDAMTPSIEAEIKRVHEAVEAAKADALKQALKKFYTNEVANDPPPPIDPNPPVPPPPGKRRSSWTGMSPEQRSAVVKARWVVRQANKSASMSEVGRATLNSSPLLLTPPVIAPAQFINTGSNDNSQPWSVAQGDCIAEMAKMANGSVDLIFTSPPYNLGQGARGFGSLWKKAKLQEGYASHSDDMPHEEYVAWQKRFLLECWRLIPDDGAIFYQHKNRIQKGVLRTPHDLNPGLPLRQILVWARRNGMNFSHRFLTPSHELIYVFAKPGFRFKKGHGLKDVLTIEPERKNPHPAPFPIELPRQIIAATTAKVILDPFAGSGTTGVAALAEGRRFIGIELDPGYVDEAKARLLAAAEEKVRATEPSAIVPAVGSMASVSPKVVDLRFGDCLAEMATLRAASVDLIAADLPYGTTACKWDCRIDLDAFWKEVRRVLTPTGTVILNSAGAFTADLIVSNRAWYKGSLVWVKTRKSQFLHAKHRPLVAHEDVLVFSPAGACLRARKKMTYNPQGVVELPEARVFEKAAVSAGVFKPITTKAAKRTQTHTGYPSTILTFASEGKNQHPTQKPVELMEYLIETYSNPGDTVLDPTMGSGTTGVAAAARGRKFIGVERDVKFFEIAEKRILGSYSTAGSTRHRSIMRESGSMKTGV